MQKFGNVVSWRKTAVIGIQIATILTLASMVGAVDAGGIQESNAPKTVCGVINILAKIAEFFAYAVGILAVIMLLYSAFLFVTQSGSEEGVGRARTYLIYALVGLAVAILAFNAVPIVTTVVGQNTSLEQCNL